jgi:hypothetical protein
LVSSSQAFSLTVPVVGTNVPADVPLATVLNKGNKFFVLSLPQSIVEGCLSNGSLNRSNDYFNRGATPVPWQVPPPFTQLPLSLDSICQNSGYDAPTKNNRTNRQIRGFGLLDTEAGYNDDPVGYHLGVDFFGYSPSVRPTSVYSIGNDGLVVGIGVGQEYETSAAYWGGSNNIGGSRGRGFSVVVRYGLIYVLYGHLKEVDRSIYVGKSIVQGERLGSIGTYYSGDKASDPHLHLEIRTFDNNFALTKTYLIAAIGHARGNDYGILSLGAAQTNNMYDAAQFFATSPAIRIQDYEANSALIPSTPFGPNIQHNTVIVLGPTCEIRYVLSLNDVPPVINGFTVSTNLGYGAVVIRTLLKGQNLAAGPDPATPPATSLYN